MTLSRFSVSGRTRLHLAALSALLVVVLAACGNKADQNAGAASAHEALAHSDHAGHAAQATDHSAHEATAHNDHAGHTAQATDHSAHEQLGAGELPGTSIYHLTTSFTDHHQQALALPDLQGAPAVFVMFFGDCNTACPILVRSAEQIQEALPEDLKQATQFVMVTFDTERDTPEKLRIYAEQKGLDQDNWHWLVGSPLQTRQLATLLGVQYRDAGNGMFAHSNLVTVVNPQGVPTARLEGLGVQLDPAIDAIRQAGL